MGFLENLRALAKATEAADNLISGKTEEEKKEKTYEEKMKAKGYVYISAYDAWVPKGAELNKAPKLFDKDGREIRPFTPDDFNNGRPKR